MRRPDGERVVRRIAQRHSAMRPLKAVSQPIEVRDEADGVARAARGRRLGVQREGDGGQNQQETGGTAEA